MNILLLFIFAILQNSSSNSVYRNLGSETRTAVSICSDGSDEKNCTICDPGREILCRSMNACLPRSLHCDGKVNCPDGSDETNCGPKLDCKPDEFTCNNSECIPEISVCDSDLDCSDGSDEMKCDPVKIKDAIESKLPLECNSPLLLCDKNTKCISPSQLCNNRQDCADGTDEIDQKCHLILWNDTTSFKPIPCEYPSRLCDNQTKCISVNQLCDNRDNCEDGSDEGGRCTNMLCHHSIVCSHDCHNAPEGLICTCPSHLYLQADKTHCLETHPCEAWGVCSQTCIKRGSSYKCTCLGGFEIQEDGFTCKSTGKGRPYIIFSNRHELIGMDLHTFNLKSLISSLKNSVNLDFYHSNETDMVFWADVIDDKIYRGTVVGGSLGNIEVVVQTGLSTAEGVAVDWIGENLYWVESNLEQIEVAKLNGSFRHTLIAGGMESPRAVAVDPRDGFLFWTDWDDQLPRIERCSMAGLNREIVVKIGSNGWPNGLTLDYTTRRIYWIEARSNSIHTTNYNGGDHHEVMRNHEMLSHPFAITLFENNVYWTDWNTKSVVRANKWTGGDVRVIQRSQAQPFDIKILHPSRQPSNGVSPCGKNNGGCSHLCLLHLNQTYRCDCPHVMRLAEDNKTCIANEKVMLISKTNEIRGVNSLQPYYNIIPTITLPQVLSPTQLDYLARNSTLYWVDSQIKEIKQSGLTHGPTETLIDTGLHSLTGIAVDWISSLLFVSSLDGIMVSNLHGEYTSTLIEDTNVLSVAVYPQHGQLYWISLKDDKAAIETSSMDGKSRKILVSNLNTNTKSLTVDSAGSKLYWITSNKMNFSDLDGKNVNEIPMDQIIVQAIAVYKNHLYFANDNDQTIHVTDKLSGTNDSIIRNSTGSVLALKIYDPTEQTGQHPCANNKGECQHLCLPSSAFSYTCKCAIGYFEDTKNPLKCKTVEEFLLFSLNWGLNGLALDGDNETKVLGPISRVSSATAIDFLYDSDTIFWADSNHGTISKIKRDGTERKFVVEQATFLDNSPIDWLTGLAVDWLSGNLYWCDSKRETIMVSRLDGTKEHMLIYEIEKPNSIAVDPVNGYLVWVGDTKVEIATLDGQNRKLLLESGSSITDVTLDPENNIIYFSDAGNNTIERISYTGENHSILIEQSLKIPVALVYYEDQIYWIDSKRKGTLISSTNEI